MLSRRLLNSTLVYQINREEAPPGINRRSAPRRQAHRTAKPYSWFSRGKWGKSRKNRESPKKDKSGQVQIGKQQANFRKALEGCGRFWICSGVPEENSGKTAGKTIRESFFPQARNSLNSRISVNGKGKPASTLGSTLPWTPWRVEGGQLSQNYCRCISQEKAMTIKMRLSKMLFFLCFRPTIKFQGGSLADPLLELPADPPFGSTSQKLFLSSFRRL